MSGIQITVDVLRSAESGQWLRGGCGRGKIERETGG